MIYVIKTLSNFTLSVDIQIFTYEIKVDNFYYKITQQNFPALNFL